MVQDFPSRGESDLWSDLQQLGISVVCLSLFFSSLSSSFSPLIFSLKDSSNHAQNAHNAQVQGELKIGKLYFHNNSSILGFLRNG